MKVKALLIGVGLGVLSGVGVAVGMTTLGDWTPYASEYATGLKFAGEHEAGCGIELPTEQGREEGMTLFFCEHTDGLSFVPEILYTQYYGAE